MVKCVWLVKRTFLMTKIDPPPNDRCLLFFIKAMRSSKIFLVFVRDISTTAPYMALHFQFSSLAIFIRNLLWSFSCQPWPQQLKYLRYIHIKCSAQSNLSKIVSSTFFFFFSPEYLEYTKIHFYSPVSVTLEFMNSYLEWERHLCTNAINVNIELKDLKYF